MASLIALLVASLLAFQATLSTAADDAAQYVLLSGELNDTLVQCSLDGNVGQFGEYGASFATDGTRTIAAEYNGEDVQCCNVDFASGTSSSPADLSLTAGSTPCSDLAECQAPDNCDPNASCVYSEVEGFMCQCTDLYEGNGQTCTRKPYWSAWGEFGPVSKTCGDGATKTRTRTCSQPGRCLGSDTDTVSVDLDACPVWSAWSKYGPYSKTCGNGAKRTRTRSCSQPGKCTGSNTQTQTSNLDACPKWSAWSAYGPYSKTCGNGVTKTRTRTCSVPGKCPGVSKQTLKVNLSSCPSKRRTSPPAMRYKLCGTRACKDCRNKYDYRSCERSGLDRDKDKSDLKSCPSGYEHHSWRYEGRYWFVKRYTHLCKSRIPAGETRYLICSKIQCVQNTAANQKLLAPENNKNRLKSCPSGYRFRDDWKYNSRGYFRRCTSTKQYWY